MKRSLVLPLTLILFAGCSSERSSGATVSGATTSEPGVETASATTAPCPDVGDNGPQGSDDPLLMSSLVGVDIRTGTHPCFERIVIELGGTGDFPGWAIEYVDGPVRLGAGDQFVEVAGDHTLLVRMAMWMPTMEGDGYSGETQLFPTNVRHVLELRETENFEGMCIWAIGLDDEYPYSVTTLHSPERLVIDVQVAA